MSLSKRLYTNTVGVYLQEEYSLSTQPPPKKNSLNFREREKNSFWKAKLEKKRNWKEKEKRKIVTI